MRILVTGGTGFIGSHLVEELIKENLQISCLVRNRNSLKWIEDKANKIEIIEGDIRKEETLYKAVKDKDVIYHLAGLTKSYNLKDFYNVNVYGTKNILKALEKVKNTKAKFIFISSLAAMGPSRNGFPLKEKDICLPVSEYGKSKLLAEKLLQDNQDLFEKLIILRPAVIYGPRDRDFLSFTKMLYKWKLNVLIQGKEKYISMCFVKDFIKILIKLLNYRQENKVELFLVSDGIIHTWGEVVEVFKKNFKINPIKVNLPLSLGYLVALFSEIIGKYIKNPNILNREKIKELSHPFWICDISKLKKKLQFLPEYSLEEGVKITVSWYKKAGWI